MSSTTRDGAERVVRVEHPDGHLEQFEGEPDSERLVRSLENGHTFEYDGSLHSEHVVRHVHPDGANCSLRTRH